MWRLSRHVASLKRRASRAAVGPSKRACSRAGPPPIGSRPVSNVLIPMMEQQKSAGLAAGAWRFVGEKPAALATVTACKSASVEIATFVSFSSTHRTNFAI